MSVAMQKPDYMAAVALLEKYAGKSMTIAQVAEVVGTATRTIRRWSAQGLFPKPVKVGKKFLRWLPGQVQMWLQERLGVLN